MPHERSTPPPRHRHLLRLAGSLAALLAAALPGPSGAAVGFGTSPPALIDTTPPVVTLTPVPPNLLLHGGQSHAFQWTTADAHPGLAAADYVAEIRDGLTPVTAVSYQSTSAATDWLWTAPEISSGYLHLVVSCRDIRGNTTTVQSDDFSVILSTSDAPPGVLPDRPELDGPHPNPCNPGTTVRFRLPTEGEADLQLWAADGTRVRRLAAGRFAAGEHTVFWDGRDDAGRTVASGTYFLRLLAGNAPQVRKLTLVR